MKILNFLSTGSGYKLIDDSKNIKNLEQNFFRVAQLFTFPESKVKTAKFK